MNIDLTEKEFFRLLKLIDEKYSDDLFKMNNIIFLSAKNIMDAP